MPVTAVSNNGATAIGTMARCAARGFWNKANRADDSTSIDDVQNDLPKRHWTMTSPLLPLDWCLASQQTKADQDLGLPWQGVRGSDVQTTQES